MSSAYARGKRPRRRLLFFVNDCPAGMPAECYAIAGDQHRSPRDKSPRDKSERFRRDAEIKQLRKEREALLAALREALPVLEFEVEQRGSSDRLYEIPARRALKVVRAAIARTEGRSDE